MLLSRKKFVCHGFVLFRPPAELGRDFGTFRGDITFDAI